MSVNQLELFDNLEEPDYSNLNDTKECSCCKRVLPNTFEFFHRNKVLGKDHEERELTNHICKDCKNERDRLVRELKKTAPPVPVHCECCGIPFSSLNNTRDIHLDHCADTEQFRGWLCKKCNTGLGLLGDNIEGLEKALAYLKRKGDDNG